MKKFLSAILALSLIWATSTVTTGCTSSQVVNEVNTVLTEATNILVVADPTAAWVPQLQKAVAALKVAETTWQSGGAVADVINALNTIEAITAVIPLTANYSALVDVLVAGIEAVLVALEPAASTATTAAAPKALFKPASNPHIGRVTIPHSVFHSRSTEFTKTWNTTALSSGLPGAVIK